MLLAAMLLTRKSAAKIVFAIFILIHLLSLFLKTSLSNGSGNMAWSRKMSAIRGLGNESTAVHERLYQWIVLEYLTGVELQKLALESLPQV
jgi:hypothetical protein